MERQTSNKGVSNKAESKKGQTNKDCDSLYRCLACRLKFEVVSGGIFSPQCNIWLERSLGHLRPGVKPSNFISVPHKRIWRTLSWSDAQQIFRFCAGALIRGTEKAPLELENIWSHCVVSLFSDRRQFKGCHHREEHSPSASCEG